MWQIVRTFASPVKCINRCSNKRAAALPVNIEHWSSPCGFFGGILGHALRHHPHGIFQSLPLVAEPDPNNFAVVA